MLATEYREVADSFSHFSQTAHRFIHIRNKRDYQKTLDLIEELMTEAEDSRLDPLNDLIKILAGAVEEYESKQDKLVRFHKKAEGIDPGVSALRLLMEQHALGASGLREEIGSKSLVSMILSGQRSLTKEHIAKLSGRFGVSPAVFFGRT
ncbi:helix-turn-helix domain-containing protein [Nitrosococcus watsonii]|uniref:Transcriptional regulator, XRE family n=1 Tax=Nitrosococcus watsoni (strain C-113) TaxID=105559 RepID=D8KC17_NITWC|nr:transcriptional regulator [Nitrosococcus watsonii]ADJ29688.1 transcriptional regulator, XRE family [Nitrosococcus watsonii C-113]